MRCPICYEPQPAHAPRQHVYTVLRMLVAGKATEDAANDELQQIIDAQLALTAPPAAPEREPLPVECPARNASESCLHALWLWKNREISLAKLAEMTCTNVADWMWLDSLRVNAEREPLKEPERDRGHRVDWYDDELAGVRSCRTGQDFTVSIYDDDPVKCPDCGTPLLLYQRQFVYAADRAPVAQPPEEG